MNVLVTGASGFVGREVVRHLHAAGHKVRILARNLASRRTQDLVSRYGVDTHPGDVLVPGSLAGAGKEVGAVLHLVGIISELGRSTFEHVHTDGTRNILAAAQRDGIRRFVYMSALGTRPNAASRYHRSKWAAEELVRRSGLDFTIFRPSLIFGPEDQFVNLFARIIRLSPIVPVLASRTARFQPVAVEAVAKAFAGSLSEPNSIGQTYDLCGPEALPLDAILDGIMAVMGRKPLKLHVPYWLARGQAAFLEMIFQNLLRKPTPLNRDQLLMLQEDNVGDGEPANSLFGLERLKFERGIEYVKRET